MSYEVELLALAIIFYLYDSSVLLYSNEVVFTCDGAKRWAATTGRLGLVFAGRTLCVLNPFTPHRPSFRLNWQFDGLELDNEKPEVEKPESENPAWSARAQDLKTLAPAILAAAIALYIFLPLGMFTALGRYAVIPAVVLLYGSTVFALLQLRRKEIVKTFSRKRFLGFAFECIACPPFAVNMVRRLTLGLRIAEPVPLAAVRLLDADRWAQLREFCIARLDEAMQVAAEHSDEVAMLEAQKQRLRALVYRP